MLDQLADASTWSMSDQETRSTLVAWTRLNARMAEVELRVAAHAETHRVGDESGATSTAAWWAHQTKLTRAAAHRDLKLAQALDTDRHEPVRAALAAGEVLVDQAAVIVAAVDALPADAEAWVAPAAGRWLLDHAADHDAKALRVLGKRIYQVIDPAAADAHESQQLEREEHDAEAAAVFRMHDDGHGKSHGRFTIPTEYAAKLRKALQALMSPRHLAGVGKDPDLQAPTPHRAGLAFMDLIDRLPVDQLPRTGGMSAAVVVTVDEEVLFGKLERAGLLDTGDRISPAAARRLACRHGIIPAVMGGKSKVLDLGAKRRFHSRDQRLVFTIEQGGCTTEGCEMPAWLCEAHHPLAWSRGGGTNRDGLWLCPHHHRRAHDNRYDTTHHPNGKVSFHLRT
jgi:hypothetical protein